MNAFRNHECILKFCGKKFLSSIKELLNIWSTCSEPKFFKILILKMFSALEKKTTIYCRNLVHVCTMFIFTFKILNNPFEGIAVDYNNWVIATNSNFLISLSFKPELGILEWWISRSMLDPLFFFILGLT